ncbi:MAG: GDP-mannose 4,6-dehydratase [Candidatus Thorarchaeota archaeon]
METIIITGANGFIGSHLIDHCISEKVEIYATEKPNQVYRNLSHYTNGKLTFTNDEKQQFLGESIIIPTDNKRLTILECDVNDAVLLEKIIKKVNPNYIFHFAAQPYITPSWDDPVGTIETNVIGTINIFEPIKKNDLKTRVMLACTSAEYGTSIQLNRPLKESDPLLAVHPYGISKIAAELLARQYYINFGIEIVNLRFFNQTGIRRVNDAPSDFVRKVAEIESGRSNPIIKVGNLDPYRDFTDIKDSIIAIWLAAIKGKPGETYNICSNKRIQIRELLKIILSFSKEKIEVVENFPEKLRNIDEDVILGDNSKIKDELGWLPKIPIEITLKEMFIYWLKYYSNESSVNLQ